MKSSLILIAMAMTSSLYASTCLDAFTLANQGHGDWKVETPVKILDCSVDSIIIPDHQVGIYGNPNRVCFFKYTSTSFKGEAYISYFMKNDSRTIGIGMPEAKVSNKNDTLSVVTESKQYTGGIISTHTRKHAVTIQDISSAEPKYNFTHSEGSVVGKKEKLFSANFSCKHEL